MKRQLDPHQVADQLARAVIARDKERCPTCRQTMTLRRNPTSGLGEWQCPAGHQHQQKKD